MSCRKVKPSKVLGVESKTTKMKKRKLKNDDGEETNIIAEDISENIKSNTKKKSKKVVTENLVDKNEVVQTSEHTDIETQTARLKRKKLKNRDATEGNDILTQSSEKLEETSTVNVEGNLKTVKGKKSKISEAMEHAKVVSNKKIKFDNDGIGKVQENSSNMEKSQKKKVFNEEEAEVNDEEIDKFCEGLNEEDNKQYENWVKLFEAKFKSSKKKV